MAKTKSYWFPHDTTAFNDMKIESMLSVYGAEGYGFYWIIIETLAMEEGYKLSSKKESVFGVLSRRTCSTSDVIKKFINDCISDFELFNSDDEYFWSESLCKRLAKRDAKSLEAKNKANIRWGKVKKKNDGSVKKVVAVVVDGFDEFWELYDKKVGKPKAESLWNKLSKKDRDDCMEYIPKYSKAQPNKKYRKNPDTFLRNKSWNDELVSDSKEEKEYSNVDIEKYKEAFE